MRGRDLGLHHQHQVLQVAQGGVQPQQEAGHQVHPGDPVQVHIETEATTLEFRISLPSLDLFQD